MSQQQTRTITLDGETDVVSGLSWPALDAVQSLLFSEMRILELQSEIAISRAERLSFLHGLKAELAKLPMPHKT